MISRDRVEAAARFIISISEADQTEVVISGQHSELTRFARSAIHQNMSEDNTVIAVRSVLGGREGLSLTNQLDEESLAKATTASCEHARHSVVNPFASALAGPSNYQTVNSYDQGTAEYGAESRADRVAEIVDITARCQAEASGSLVTSSGELLVANSAGVSAYTPLTEARVSVITDRSGVYGFATGLSRNIENIDFVSTASRASLKCSAFAESISMPAGEYEVILEPPAVETMISFLSINGFGARSYHEGRSCLSGNMGKKLLGRNVSIWDDGTDPCCLAVPFDYQGVPKRKVAFIQDGVATGVAYDVETAARYGAESTGHGLSPEARQYTSDPIAMNLVMAGGEATFDEMVASTKRGILVTRFHYTNTVHQLKAIITGMTRDGTFLIENGKVTAALRNFRFTQSIPEALNNVSMIEKDLTLVPGDFWGSGLVPALKISHFHFSGSTEH